MKYCNTVSLHGKLCFIEKAILGTKCLLRNGDDIISDIA